MAEWIEIFLSSQYKAFSQSPLAMAEWIEIPRPAPLPLIFWFLRFRWRSGFKFTVTKLYSLIPTSPLAMAEWIEIKCGRHCPDCIFVSASDGGVD